MDINHDIILNLEKKIKCPILELFKDDSNCWYVCFEEYICIKGINQLVHIDELLKELDKYDNIKYLTHECYIDDEQDDTWYEQVSFQWIE